MREKFLGHPKIHNVFGKLSLSMKKYLCALLSPFSIFQIK